MHPDEPNGYPRDQNKCAFSGTVVDEPKLKVLKSGQKSIKFTFLTIEDFTLSNGTSACHENYLTIEALGRQAENYLNELVVGNRYQIEAYARAEGTEVVFRVYKIQTDRVHGARRK
jgi:single-stranded DNA-binding protein